MRASSVTHTQKLTLVILMSQCCEKENSSVCLYTDWKMWSTISCAVKGNSTKTTQDINCDCLPLNELQRKWVFFSLFFCHYGKHLLLQSVVQLYSRQCCFLPQVIHHLFCIYLCMSFCYNSGQNRTKWCNLFLNAYCVWVQWGDLIFG